MFNFCWAGRKVVFASLLTVIVRVLVRVVRLRRHHLRLPLGTGKIHSWTCVILRQTVSTTELSTAVWAMEREIGFLLADLAFHLANTPFYTYL